MRDTYMDCPDRERAQWWGDAVNEMGEAFYALDRNADLLAKKGIYELMRFQRPDGVIFAPIPGSARKCSISFARGSMYCTQIIPGGRTCLPQSR